VRAVIDYRPALRQRSGVGEYTHQLVRGLRALANDATADAPLDLSIFSSSWKDRLALSPELAGVAAVDRRVPVAVLNFAWHRLGWPPAEMLMNGAFDVTHSLHPLLLPARNAAQVVTIHDLNFLTHPERTRAEIRRDYPVLAADHARRADRVVVPSHFTATEVERRLGVPLAKIDVCPPGRPDWTPRASVPDDGYVLFFGTLEPRKNVGGLLDAYDQLVRTRSRVVPELVIAGKALPGSEPWLERLNRPPLRGLARHIGYVDPANRRTLYDGARLLVQPSFEEGFGIPVLEAMTAGVPVVAAARGALPEVLGDAGILVDPEDPDAIAKAIARFLDDRMCSETASAAGVARSARFSWTETARLVYRCYQRAIDHRRCASA
jgi:glycosyltransferase involved in cell wall biosynthesis